MITEGELRHKASYRSTHPPTGTPSTLQVQWGERDLDSPKIINGSVYLMDKGSGPALA